MRKFKSPNRDQLMLFPPSLQDWVGPNHPARFVLSFVDSIELSSFYARYGEAGDGQPPYDPHMMVSVLLYASMLGVTSSRKIERLIQDHIGFQFIVAGLCPDHDTIASFRERHKHDMKGVFKACVQVAIKADVVSLNHVAVDGTKIAANAAQHQRQTAEAIKQEIRRLEKFADEYIELAEKVDAAEDAEFGKERNAYLLPEHLHDEEALRRFIKKELNNLADEHRDDDDESGTGGTPSVDETTRAPQKPIVHESKAIRKARKRLEKLRQAEESLKIKERMRKEEDPTGKRERDSQRKRGGKPYVAKINVTDPDSRIMLMRDLGYRDAYNAQIAVDGDFGIIVAADLVQDCNDVRQLEPMLKQIQSNTDWFPAHASMDNGYFNVEQMERFPGVEFYIPPRKRGKNESLTTKAETMRQKLETEMGRAVYGLRKTLVEPVFGIIKHARKYRQALCRGKDMVGAEWQLHCTAHNLLKLMHLGVVFS